jgi:predicted exporter/SAM-dependent methyltransferase
MPLRNYPIRWPLVIAVILIMSALFLWESRHLKIETDILETLPHDDPVLAAAHKIIKRLPTQDKVFINLEQSSSDRESLIAAAERLSEKLIQSGLFEKVGIGDEAQNFPALIAHVQDHLPSLLSADDLEQKIAPLLTPKHIRESLRQLRRELEQLEGIGRGDMTAKDPLGFSGVILNRMTALLPAGKAQFYRGQLISEDGRNVLIIAKIKGSGTDTKTAARINRLLEDMQKQLEANKDFGHRFRLTSAGAYRVALDNETIAQKDVRMAVTLTTLGITLLLIFVFPRPLIGLAALLPSMAGAVAALFVCSFLFNALSLLAIGFGGAIMAFTIDLSITYLLFLDQPYATDGRKVSREIWSAELLAALTTIGAFLLLLVSDFKILSEIGVFSALGVLFVLIFVHALLPKALPAMPPAKRESNRFLKNAVNQIAAPATWKWVGALAFGAAMLFFVKPVYNVDLNAMNSMSEETILDGEKMKEVWGDFSGRSYVFLEAQNLSQLQKKNDALMSLLNEETRRGKLSAVFLPSVLFPSPETARGNFAAWRAFWNKERTAAFKRDLDAASRECGFTPEAFAPLWQIIHQTQPAVMEIPEKYFEMLGIAKSPSGFTQLSLIPPGRHYDAEDFFKIISQSGLAGAFDGHLFNRRLGDFLKSLFLEIALITSIGLVGVIFLYFLDWQLTLAAIAPIVFALTATLGTLKIIGHPVDIPGIMLWVVIMGMGIDYAIYYICTYQRHPDNQSPAMQNIRLAIFLAAFTTLIGFGVLTLAGHSLLRSIGLVSLLGIFYSFLGSFFILPTLMEKIFAPIPRPEEPPAAGTRNHLRRTARRYRHLPAYPRVFACMKMMMDPMFQELHRYVKNPRRILDVGCGYGVPAAWLLEIHPQAQVFGVDPDEERVLIASRVIGNRGRVVVGQAPDLPEAEGDVDCALMLDMLHFLDDHQAETTLQRIYDRLRVGKTLVLRATIPSGKPKPWKRWIETIRLTFTRTPNRFRSEQEVLTLMQKAGFSVEVFASDVPGIEEKWFVGEKRG